MGKRGEVVVRPLDGRLRIPVQLVDVPAAINEIDVLQSSPSVCALFVCRA
jgi:hypothetical protein